jgi:AcrR family transcriptional regulator
MSGRNPAPRRSYGGRSAQERRSERRARLLGAALELFGTRGFAATSIERLCADAGVSTRNFYEEFSGREELLTALHRNLNERATAAVARAFAQYAEEDLATRVRRAIHAYVTTAAGDPRWARITFVEVIGVSPEVEHHRLWWRERWSRDIAAIAAEAGAGGATVERDYRLSAIAVIGAVNSLVHHWSSGGRDTPLEEVTAELTRLTLAALCPPTPR